MIEAICYLIDLDFDAESSLVHFNSNHGWRGHLDNLEIVDKRKGMRTCLVINEDN